MTVLSATTLLPARTAAPLPVLAALAMFLRDGMRAMQQPISSLGWRGLPALLYVLAIGGDMLTTTYGMHSGISEESNPIAQIGMETFTLVGYITMASVLAAAIIVPLAGRPPSTGMRIVQAWAMVLCSVKLWIVVTNAQMLIEERFYFYDCVGCGWTGF